MQVERVAAWVSFNFASVSFGLHSRCGCISAKGSYSIQAATGRLCYKLCVDGFSDRLASQDESRLFLGALLTKGCCVMLSLCWGRACVLFPICASVAYAVCPHPRGILFLGCHFASPHHNKSVHYIVLAPPQSCCFSVQARAPDARMVVQHMILC